MCVYRKPLKTIMYTVKFH